MVSFLICYFSWSGNTKEVAEIIEKTICEENIDVTMYRIGTKQIPNMRDFDAILFGTFTWGKGETPVDVKNFVAHIGYKPTHVYVFGTGDTQFGGDTLFCLAAKKLAKFYHSTFPPLMIEQSPRGKQEASVVEWTKGVLEHWKSLEE